MPRPRPPEQLDIPLVWDVDPPAPAEGPSPRSARPPAPVGVGRLVVAALADLGVTLVALAISWLVAAAAGGLDTVQLSLASIVGIEVATIVGVGCLWGWRGTPGLLLLGVGFDHPLVLGRATALWLLWLLALPLAGLPLWVGRRKLAERLGDAALRPRWSRAGA